MESKREKTIEIKRGNLEEGDRLFQTSHHQAVLMRAGGEWWCECKEWEWDCDIGPGGDVWCTKVCVRMECDRLPVVGSMATARQ